MTEEKLLTDLTTYVHWLERDNDDMHNALREQRRMLLFCRDTMAGKRPDWTSEFREECERLLE